jgi:hypothetical protein
MTRDGPPCIRHMPFAVAGDWHRLPLRVLAPQRVCAGVLVPKLGAGARPDHPLSDGCWRKQTDDDWNSPLKIQGGLRKLSRQMKRDRRPDRFQWEK